MHKKCRYCKCFWISLTNYLRNGIQETGETYGDMFEVSNVRKDDFEYIKDITGEYGEVLQIGQGNSRSRGHQYPAAFLQTVE